MPEDQNKPRYSSKESLGIQVELNFSFSHFVSASVRLEVEYHYSLQSLPSCTVAARLHFVHTFYAGDPSYQNHNITVRTAEFFQL